MTAQSVILPLPSDHARFLVLRLKDLSITELKEKLADLFSTRDRLITQHPHAQIKTGVAFGPELWAQLYEQSPDGFKQLQPIQGAYPMPVVPADAGRLYDHGSGREVGMCATNRGTEIGTDS